MEVRLLEKDKAGMKVNFMLKDTTPAFANALRRIMMMEVPTMAIEDVEIKKNNSLLYDEMLAHRLGLVVLKTDLRSYELPEKCSCKGEGCAKCQLKLVLKAKGEKTVYASDIKSSDPKVIPVFPKTIIAKLLKGQDIELEATAVLGKGKEHVKWSPCLSYYTNKPNITVNNNSKSFEKFKDKYPAQIFDKNGKIDNNAIIELKLVDAVDGVCDDIVKVDYEESNFIFTVESWGQLQCKEIIKSATDIITEKTSEFIDKVKALE